MLWGNFWEFFAINELLGFMGWFQFYIFENLIFQFVQEADLDSFMINTCKLKLSYHIFSDISLKPDFNCHYAKPRTKKEKDRNTKWNNLDL